MIDFKAIPEIDENSFDRSLQLPVDQFMPGTTTKNQICLHHTASGPGIRGDFNYWRSTKTRVATHFMIAHDGTIHLVMPLDSWGHHLGVRKHVFERHGLDEMNSLLNQKCFGIEIDSWGPLCEVNGKFKSWAGVTVDGSKVQSYSKAFKKIPKSEYFDSVGATNAPSYIYERYTDEQVKSVYQLVRFLSWKYNIPLTNDGKLFEVTVDALSGKPGIYTHNSYRVDKQDIHPQPEVVDMLQFFNA